LVWSWSYVLSAHDIVIDVDLLADPMGWIYAYPWARPLCIGLKDEYELSPGDVPVIPSIMNSQWLARKWSQPDDSGCKMAAVLD
jgi:hypothetical protein